MQLHADTNIAATAPSLPVPVTTTANKQYGVVDMTQLKSPADVASSLDNAAKDGWKLKLGIGNYAIFTQ